MYARCVHQPSTVVSRVIRLRVCALAPEAAPASPGARTGYAAGAAAVFELGGERIASGRLRAGGLHRSMLARVRGRGLDRRRDAAADGMSSLTSPAASNPTTAHGVRAWHTLFTSSSRTHGRKENDRETAGTCALAQAVDVRIVQVLLYKVPAPARLAPEPELDDAEHCIVDLLEPEPEPLVPSETVRAGPAELLRHLQTGRIADVNAAPQDKWTLLHWAARLGAQHCASLLLEHGPSKPPPPSPDSSQFPGTCSSVSEVGRRSCWVLTSLCERSTRGARCNSALSVLGLSRRR